MDHREEYLDALIDAKTFHTSPVGFSNEETGSKQDQIIIKQNNVMIILLLRIIEKLEGIKTSIKGKSPANDNIKEELDSIIKSINNIKLDKPKPQPYKFITNNPNFTQTEKRKSLENDKNS